MLKTSVPRDVIFTVLDDEAVLLDLRRGVYYAADPVATRAWELLRLHHGDVGVVARVLSHEYDAPVDDLAADVRALLAKFAGPPPRTQPSSNGSRARSKRLSPTRTLRRAPVAFVRLPIRRKLTLVQVFLLAAAVEAGLRWLSVRRLGDLLGVPLSTVPVTGPVDELDPWSLDFRTRRCIWAINVVFRHWPPGDTCLRRALVLGRLLRHENPVLRIGVSRQADSLAHAWLETPRGTIGTEADFTPLLADQ
jgi:hypothetical protein